MDLDALRMQMNKMTDRVLMRMHDRAWFPLNPSVYVPGAVPLADGSGSSLLEFALRGLETYHASLGRFEAADQHPLVISSVPASAAKRAIDVPAIPAADISIRERIVPYYIDSILPALCSPGEDQNTFGETAYVDADLLELLHERINIGRYVAHAKAQANEAIVNVISDRDALAALLRDEAREAKVLNDVEARAERYEIDAALARRVFAWVIEQTLDLEVVYLQAVARG